MGITTKTDFRLPLVFLTIAFSSVVLFSAGCERASIAGVEPNPGTTQTQDQEKQASKKTKSKNADATQDKQESASKIKKDVRQPKKDVRQPKPVFKPKPMTKPGETPATDRSSESAHAAGTAPEDETPGQEKQTIEIGDSWKRLGKRHEIWIDMKKKQVMAAGNICLIQGGLEVLICPRRTKEHESIISLNATALQVHTALIALGADPGHPVRWPFGEQKVYEPATGPVIKIRVKWNDGKNVVEFRAQELVRDFATKKPLEQDWVFGGSEFYEDPHSKSKVYYGDSGELVCLSNFATATMDLPIKSSSSDVSLLYEANPKVLPPLGTKVYVTFEPVLDAKNKNTKKNASKVRAEKTETETKSGDNNSKDK